MANQSNIEWTEATWNPITGCSKVSAGCKNCYAERLAIRLQAMGNTRYRNGFKLTLHDDLIELPKHWRDPRLIFVNSMSDLFHEQVPAEFIRRLFSTMRACPQHTFQILTKRSTRLRRLASQFDWPANVWMGVSVEDARVFSRIDDLFGFSRVNRSLGRSPVLI
jgi:protein gp37